MDAINKYQSLGTYTQQYRTICWRHFSDSDFLFQGHKRLLKSNTVPTIFDEEERYDSKRIKQCSSFKSNDSDEACNKDSCINSNIKIAELRTTIANMKIKHDLEKQILEKKVDKLADERRMLSDKLTDLRKAFSKEKEQKHCLTNVIDELKAERYISSNDEKFLEVGLLFVISTIPFKMLFFNNSFSFHDNSFSFHDRMLSR